MNGGAGISDFCCTRRITQTALRAWPHAVCFTQFGPALWG